LSHFPAVAILGPRQVGKTTLAKSLQKQLKKKSIYLDLERYEDLAKLTEPSLFLESRMDKCIILDEIQRRPSIFPELRSLIDRNRIPGRFLILGSASSELIRQSSESLAGRISYIELAPFQISEINSENWQDLWLRGGFPNPFLIQDDEIRKEWFHSFITTYIERDLPSLGLITSPVQLRTFINMISGLQGNLLNQQMLSRSLGVSSTTIARYLDYLENAFLIRRLQPYHINIRKRLIKSPKIFIRDTGIFHYLTGLSDNNQLWNSAYLGYSWESFVVEQILISLGHNINGWFYRTQDGTECDLLLTAGNRPIACIETKITSSPEKTKSLTVAINDLGTDQNFIIIPKCDEPYKLSEKIMVCNISQFIGTYLPLLN
jgi:predicted AAA+ superfamily ATPase